MEKLRKKNHMPWIWDHYQMEMNNDTEPKILYELCINIDRMLYKYFGPPRDDYKEWSDDLLYKTGWLISKALQITRKNCPKDFLCRDGDHLAAWVYLYIWGTNFVESDGAISDEGLYKTPGNVNTIMRKAVMHYNYDRRFKWVESLPNLIIEEIEDGEYDEAG